MAQNYDLWCFLDLANYGEGKVARELERHLNKSPEFRGRSGTVIYFEFETPYDRLNFMITCINTLRDQGYRHVVTKESHPFITNGDYKKTNKGRSKGF
jgi:hypothetical protein